MAQMGVDFLLYVNTSTDPATPTWVLVGGQKGATLNLSNDGIDVTTKDSNGWKEEVPGFNSWSIDFEGLALESDNGLSAIETAYMNRQTIKVKLEMPSGTTYTGNARIEKFSYDGPHDDPVNVKGTLAGTGALTKA
ncbi:phage tail tube protein [Carboxydothermus hydrogenoformans]|uniref:Phage major tail protein, TP901-1 family n=1 Tax=Carboxydothermus hydrogenoformans (strain ATCC BAA-161 / DSM 6008 / Z-2901) TaxID=246194 RepID=Q3ABJ9_CARHZ|nr:phage major tail protein, TP901-1 family [Carboxydothermus hydrogenoformans]ABB15446.1 conserved hypothetical protein [Carboxydothermus hydrogenoformans Z-2901]